MTPARELVLFHSLPDLDSATIRRWIVERGLKPRVDFQNVDTEGREMFTARGGRRVPALWDGERLHEGPDTIRLALGAIIAREERGEP